MTEIGAFVEWMIYLVVTMMILAVWWQVKVATSTQFANRFLLGLFVLSTVGYFFYYLFVLMPQGGMSATAIQVIAGSCRSLS